MTGYEKMKQITAYINGTSLPVEIKHFLIKKYEIRFRYCKTKKSRHEMTLRINAILELLFEVKRINFDEYQTLYIGIDEKGE